MAMTGTQFIDEVRSNIKRTEDGVASTRIMLWVNWAQSQIADWHTYEEMGRVLTGSTVANQKRYGFPDQMKDIMSMTLQDGASSSKLTYVYYREFDAKVPRPEQTTTGRPNWYVDFGTQFELYRIPDTVYTLNLRASIYPTDYAVSTTSTASALVRKDALITAVATMFGFLSLRELEDATYWKNEVAKPLFIASLETDHRDVDWTPIARGFDTRAERISDYANNPLVQQMP